MAQLQESQNEKPQMRKRLAFLVVIVLPLIAGAILWILNAMGVIVGPWSSLFAAAFPAVGAISAVIGVTIALFQWKRSFLNENALKSTPPSILRERMPAVYLEEINLGANKRKGALFIKVKRKWGGTTAYLGRGFDKNTSSVEMASNVVLRRVDGSPTFVAIFPALEPGNYTASLPSAGLKANVELPTGYATRYKQASSKREK